MQQSISFSHEQVVEEQKKFILKVYNWMGSGLLITGIVSWYVSQSPVFLNLIFGNAMIPFLLFGAEIGLVVYLSARINKMNLETAKYVYMGYSALNGLTLSFIFIMYTSTSIASTFVVTAGTFGAMSLYGYTTKKDLTSWGSFLFMGLLGIIIASFVNIFLQSPAMYWLSTYAGVLIFTGLTAYDTQKIKEMNASGFGGTEENTKKAILGALTLYLDFINLFIMLLRIMGNQRD